MVNERFFIFIFLLVAFILLIVLIRYWSLGKKSYMPSVLTYEKLDLLRGDITLLTVEEFEEDVSELTKKGYELSSPKELYDFMEHGSSFPEKIFVILIDFDAPQLVKSFKQKLSATDKSIIFFKSVHQKNLKRIKS